MPAIAALGNMLPVLRNMSSAEWQGEQNQTRLSSPEAGDEALRLCAAPPALRALPRRKSRAAAPRAPQPDPSKHTDFIVCIGERCLQKECMGSSITHDIMLQPHEKPLFCSAQGSR